MAQKETRPSEVRIGNLIWFGDDVCSVYEINDRCFYVMGEEEQSFKNTTCELYPIDLSEEWLISLGFKKAGQSDIFGGFVSPEMPNGSKIRIKNNEWNSQHCSVAIKRVHQLQNLYFALTGTELTLNQNPR